MITTFSTFVLFFAEKPVPAAVAVKPLKRIPPYDYKARFNDLLEKHTALKEKYAEVESRMDEADRMEQELAACQEEVRSCSLTLVDCFDPFIVRTT